MKVSGPARRVGVVEVARVAGVSPQTVSNVMNRRGGFSDETRERVMAAIEATGYQPNRAARLLRTREARALAFNLTSGQMDVRNPFAFIVLKSLVARAAELGYHVTVLTQSDGSPEAFRADVSNAEVDGVIVSDCTYGDYRTAILTELGIPFAVLGRSSLDEAQAWVDLDNRQAMHLVVDHLVDRGHRSFGYVGYSPGTEHWYRERLEGTRERLHHHGLTLPSRAVVRLTTDDLALGTDRYLARKTRPTAIIVESDSIAVHLVNGAHRRGLILGADLAITGFDGPLADTVLPRLTTVVVPIAEIAASLVERLVHQIANPGNHDSGLMLAGSLEVGGTT